VSTRGVNLNFRVARAPVALQARNRPPNSLRGKRFLRFTQLVVARWRQELSKTIQQELSAITRTRNETRLHSESQRFSVSCYCTPRGTEARESPIASDAVQLEWLVHGTIRAKLAGILSQTTCIGEKLARQHNNTHEACTSARATRWTDGPSASAYFQKLFFVVFRVMNES
jgi:hypothetical protein